MFSSGNNNNNRPKQVVPIQFGVELKNHLRVKNLLISIIFFFSLSLQTSNLKLKKQAHTYTHGRMWSGKKELKLKKMIETVTQNWCKYTILMNIQHIRWYRQWSAIGLNNLYLKAQSFSMFIATVYNNILIFGLLYHFWVVLKMRTPSPHGKFKIIFHFWSIFQ